MGDITTSRKMQPEINIVEKVSEMEDRDPLSLPPLYNSIDPDALNQLAESSKIQFEYAGYDITVENGTISIDQ